MNISSSPSRSDGRTGVSLIKLRGKLFGAAQPLLRVGVAKSLDQLGIDPGRVLVGQVMPRSAQPALRRRADYADVGGEAAGGGGGRVWGSRHNPGLSGGRFLLYRLEKEA